MQQKILAYRRWQDAYGSLFGKLLLEKALRQAGLSEDLTDFHGGRVWVNGSHWHLKNLPIFPGYACHITCEHPAGEITTAEITPQMI